jgi:hypothetical protein
MVGETYRRKREVEIVYSSESEDQSDSDTDDSDDEDGEGSNFGDDRKINEKFKTLLDILLWPGAGRRELVNALRSRINLDISEVVKNHRS